MNKDKMEEIEYIPTPPKEEGEDPVTTLIKRLAVVVRHWAKDELSGRQMRVDQDIDY